MLANPQLTVPSFAGATYLWQLKGRAAGVTKAGSEAGLLGSALSSCSRFPQVIACLFLLNDNNVFMYSGKSLGGLSKHLPTRLLITTGGKKQKQTLVH